jgi:hypothetical protein
MDADKRRLKNARPCLIPVLSAFIRAFIGG